MDIHNETPFDCRAIHADRSVGRVAVVVVKSTFDVLADGSLHPSETSMPLVNELEVTEFGLLQSDICFRKQGCDLCVMGHVQKRQPTREAALELRVGHKTLSRLRVSGDRTWLQGPSGHLRPSAPQAFESMPLSYRRSYGGQVTFEDGSTAIETRNPDGMGLYRRPEQAQGHPIPNIEYATDTTSTPWDHDQRIPGWGPYPSFWELRATMAVHLNETKDAIASVERNLFNQAHPDLILEEAPIGQTIRIEGMRDHPLYYQVPQPPAQIGVRFDDTYTPLKSELDGIFIWPDAAKLALTQRARVIYTPRAEQQRRFEIRHRNEQP